MGCGSVEMSSEEGVLIFFCLNLKFEVSKKNRRKKKKKESV